MSATGEALNAVGVNIPGDPFGSFAQQNLSPSDLGSIITNLPQTVGGIPGIGNSIPGLGKIPIPILDKLPKILSFPNRFKLGQSGEWQSASYADDLNAHHPKFKFLFKVKFDGFPGQGTDASRAGEFYYFVHKVDRPKVVFNHQDVNYYNFRSRVLTSMQFTPMSMTFLDEIGNSVNFMFQRYLEATSGMASGGYGIDSGFGASSSTKPYKRGYSHGKKITVEQIFANGTHSNRFIFLNPRIETFELDELSMEESAGSMATITFTYDALSMETVKGSRLYGWGNMDLLRGGIPGIDGLPRPNAGDTNAIGQSSLTESPGSAGGLGIGGLSNFISSTTSSLTSEAGLVAANAVPGALQDLAAPGSIGGQLLNSGFKNFTGSGGDVLSSNIQGTLATITSGQNLSFGGASTPPFSSFTSGDVVEVADAGKYRTGTMTSGVRG